MLRFFVKCPGVVHEQGTTTTAAKGRSKDSEDKLMASNAPHWHLHTQSKHASTVRTIVIVGHGGTLALVTALVVVIGALIVGSFLGVHLFRSLYNVAAAVAASDEWSLCALSFGTSNGLRRVLDDQCSLVGRFLGVAKTDPHPYCWVSKMAKPHPSCLIQFSRYDRAVRRPNRVYCRQEKVTLNSLSLHIIEAIEMGPVSVHSPSSSRVARKDGTVALIRRAARKWSNLDPRPQNSTEHRQRIHGCCYPIGGS